MPIKPENRARYPKDWKAIRAEVLTRAGNRCEWPGCGLEHLALGLRDLTGKWWPFADFEAGRVPDSVRFEKDGETERDGMRIILTIAHRDHTPENNGTPGNRPNLRAWCQYHHLAYDRPHHIANGRITRNKRKGQESLPLQISGGQE